MRNLMISILLSLVVSSCTKEPSGSFETSQGRITLLVSDGETVPLEEIEVFIRTGQCQSDCFLCSPDCEFVENLKERTFSDNQGNYTLMFFVKTGRTFEPQIVIPENYRLVQSGGRNPAIPGETFYYDFLLEAVD